MGWTGGVTVKKKVFTCTVPMATNQSELVSPRTLYPKVGISGLSTRGSF